MRDWRETMRPERGLAPLLAAALLLSGCRPAPGPMAGPVARSPTSLPVAEYDRLAAEGGTVYRLDPGASRIDVVVRREGPLARFGHDHVIVVEAPEGLAAATPGSARADVVFCLDTLAVDPAAARARHGLTSEPDAEDIAGTRRNMLETTLAADTWPVARIAARLAPSLEEAREVALEVDLHGQRLRQTVPVHVERDGEGLTVRSRFDLSQRAFGIEPYSALGGGLRVADALTVDATLRFDPVVRRTAGVDEAVSGGMHGAR